LVWKPQLDRAASLGWHLHHPHAATGDIPDRLSYRRIRNWKLDITGMPKCSYVTRLSAKDRNIVNKGGIGFYNETFFGLCLEKKLNKAGRLSTQHVERGVATKCGTAHARVTASAILIMAPII